MSLIQGAQITFSWGPEELGIEETVGVFSVQRGLVFSAPGGRSMSANTHLDGSVVGLSLFSCGSQESVGKARDQCMDSGRECQLVNAGMEGWVSAGLWHLLQTSASAHLILRAFLQGPTKQHDEIIRFIFPQESAGSKLLQGL